MPRRAPLFALACLAGLGLACAISAQAPGQRDGSQGGVPSPLKLPALGPTGRGPERVLLVSVGGLRAAHYRSDVGVSALMPTVAALARAGVSADAVIPVTPAASYPAHATLVTGQRPDRHGVVGNRLLGEHGLRPARYLHASRIQGGSLWQAAHEVGLSVVALGWPSTLGAPIGLLLPELAPLSGSQSWLGLLRDTTTPWLLEQLSGQPLAAAWFSRWPTPAERDAALVDLACSIASREGSPRLWLLHLIQASEGMQRYGPESQQARAALSRTDREIQRLIECLAAAGLLDSSALVLVGDHAVAPVHTRVDPNVALLRAGLLVGDPKAETGIESWSAIVQSNGASAFVYARSESAAVEARRVLSEEASRTRAFRVVSAAELQALRGDPQAWFGLEAEPGFGFGDAVTPPALRAATLRGLGGHLSSREGSEVGLVAWGRGLRRAVHIPRMHQVDVAPTVAVLLGLGLRFEQIDGRPFVGALDVPIGQGAAAGAPR
ncbi:MAG: alkaline phosphatase family protein [Myxococcota bacterium]